MIKLKLLTIDGTEKTISKPNGTARDMLNYLKFVQKVNAAVESGNPIDEADQVEEVVELLVGIFSDPTFTLDNALDLLPTGSDFWKVSNEVFIQIMGGEDQEKKQPTEISQ